MPNGTVTDKATDLPPVLWRPSRPARGEKAAPADPVFLSTAPTAAVEGSAYTYAMIAYDPQVTGITFSLTSGPTGASITGDTLTWAPTTAQSRAENAFSVKATTAAGGSATQSFSVSPAGTVSGTKITTYVNDAGETNVPTNLSAVTIAAWVPNGAGGYTKIQGTGDASGNFSVPGVPAGTYLMQVGTDYLETTKSVTDFGSWAFGRSDRVLGGSGTTVQYSLTGAGPWASGDFVNIIGANNGVYRSLPASYANGATTLEGTASWSGAALLDATKGDQVYVEQLQQQPTQIQNSNHINYVLHVLTRLAGPAALTMTNGVANPLNAAFADVSTGSSVRFYLHATAFQNLAAASNPNAASGGDAAYFIALPYALKYGGVGPGIDLVSYNGENGALNDSDFGEINAGAVVPAWTRAAYIDSARLLTYVLPAGAFSGPRSIMMAAHVNTITNVLPTTGSPVEPLVGNVLNPMINGADLFSNLTGISTTPTISWTAPALGSPTYYRVGITLLQSSPATLATFYTTSTSLKLPASGFFPTGLTGTPYYFVKITAVFRTGIDGTTSPLRNALPSAEAPVFSGMVTP